MVLGGNGPGRCVPISRDEDPVTRSCDLGANCTDLALLEFGQLYRADGFLYGDTGKVRVRGVVVVINKANGASKNMS